MAREFAKSFYHSKQWVQTSRAYMSSKHYVCERCGGVGEICHHREYLTPKNIDDPYITLNWDNLECLCRDCHAKEHYRSRQGFGVSFDADGNIIKAPNVFIVCGSPGSGKTHYVKTHKGANDLVVDFDYLCAALSCSDDIYFNHLPIINVAMEVREHIYTMIENRTCNWSRAFVITSEPDISLQKLLAFRLKGEVVTMDVTPEKCIENIKNDTRRKDKEKFVKLVYEWYEKNEISKRGETKP